ncbi:grem1 (predicted) [Pycnogonum litorale]
MVDWTQIGTWLILLISLSCVSQQLARDSKRNGQISRLLEDSDRRKDDGRNITEQSDSPSHLRQLKESIIIVSESESKNNVTRLVVSELSTLNGKGRKRKRQRRNRRKGRKRNRIRHRNRRRKTFLRAMNKLSSTKVQLVTRNGNKLKKRRDWCKTEPMKQTIEEPGCISRTIMNNFCYGQCHSFFVPKTMRGDVFRSCATCKPKRSSFSSINLVCPGKEPSFVQKKILVVQQCRCLTEILQSE